MFPEGLVPPLFRRFAVMAIMRARTPYLISALECAALRSQISAQIDSIRFYPLKKPRQNERRGGCVAYSKTLDENGLRGCQSE